MSLKTLTLDDRLYRYLLDHSLREDPLMRELREETSLLPEANMQISPEQGQFMAWLVGTMGAERCLEVGVFTGYSSLCVARALPDHGRLVACDLSEEWTDIARRYWQRAGLAERIELHLAPALDTLQGLIADGGSGRYDFAFIDADKTGYAGYYEACMELLRPGGVIAFDNMLWSGAVADPSVDDEDTRALRALNDRLHGDEKVDFSLLPLGDGLALVRKRL